jgi:coenzyme F420-reducing hydrogenase beta subunit
VCPFLDHAEDETTLGRVRFWHIPGILHTPETGYYLKNYVGYASGGQREQSASGGLATWMLIKLLTRKCVDGVVCVVPGRQNNLFEYKLCREPSEVQSAARSAYHPVEISGLLKMMRKVHGRYAVTCLPCVAKALRLACISDRVLESRIAYIVGLVCGQTKSRLFAEYCAAASGGEPKYLKSIQFRKKTPKDYSQMGYECTFIQNGCEERRPVIGWKEGYGKVWNNFAFTPNPCLFCDDIFAETADICLMDAWLPEYSKESLGTSIVLLRNTELLALVEEGAASGELLLSPISVQRVVESQSYQVLNKRRLILTRMIHSKNAKHVPRKRIHLFTKPSWIEQIQEKKRLCIQADSPELWRNRRTLEEFILTVEQMERLPLLLQLIQRFLGFMGRIARYFIRILKG